MKKDNLFVLVCLVSTVVGFVERKRMKDAGMIKSFWLPCAIKKPGTYTTK